MRLCGVGELECGIIYVVYRVIGKTFGVWFRPLGAFGLLQLRQVISAITLGLDYVFYPESP